MQILQLNNTGVVPYTIKQFFDKNPSYGVKMDLAIPMFTSLDRQFQLGLEDVIELDPNPVEVTQFLQDNLDKYDIIHVNALYQYLPIIKYTNSQIKVVYTGHGSDVRQHWHHDIFKYSDYVTCSTSDLRTIASVDYIPNVPDPYHFRRTRDAVPNKALIKKFDRPIVDDLRGIAEAKNICRKNNYTLEIYNRGVNMFPYMVYPKYLQMFGVFFDFKYLKYGVGYEKLELPLSYTALQFLQLGGTVYHHSGIYKELPEPYNNYEGVMERWYEIYESIIHS